MSDTLSEWFKTVTNQVRHKLDSIDECASNDEHYLADYMLRDISKLVNGSIGYTERVLYLDKGEKFPYENR